MSQFVEFVEKLNAHAAQYIKEMEKVIFVDPSSSIVKARKFAETIINEVFKHEKMDATYSSFYEKVSYLARDGIIDRKIQKSFDTVRISGNKAAHPGEFNDLPEAFKLHREIYNISVWFYELYTLETIIVPIYEHPTPGEQQNVEEILQKKLEELFGSSEVNTLRKSLVDNKNSISIPSDDVQQSEDDTNDTDALFLKDLPKGQSYLFREVQRLKESSKEAVENANEFSVFKNYLHVDRKVQLDLEEVLKINQNQNKSSLVLLCGNVGDGKSHLLAYLKENRPELIKGYKIHNDATESFSPEKTAMETLSEVLNGFSDDNIDCSNDHVILAINMGVLHNFITTEHEAFSYNKLKEFIEDSGLFSQNVTTHFSDENFNLLSFGDYHPYELTNQGAISTFYTSLIEKVTNNSEKNPFYLALKEDEGNNIDTMVHGNFRLLQNKVVQDCIVQIIIQSIVKKKLIISARAFLNFIADILIPDDIKQNKIMSEFDVLENSLPNLLFNRVERSEILRALSDLDPIHYRSINIDDLIINLNTLDDWNSTITNNIKDDIPINWLKPLLSNEVPSEHSFDLFVESFVRLTYLTNEKFANKIQDESYIKYLTNLYYFNVCDKQKVKAYYEEIKSAIYKWKGSPKKDYIYLNKAIEKFRLAQKMNIKPSIDHLHPSMSEKLESFKSMIQLVYKNESDAEIKLEIDYPLYKLLTKVLDGYRPNKKDEEDAIKFVEFIDKLMAYGDKNEEILIYFTTDQRLFSISRDDFGSFVFEREKL